MFDNYQPEDLPAKPNADSVKSRGPLDKRLPADNLVLGVVAGKEARAYPLEALAKAGLVKDTLDAPLLWCCGKGKPKPPPPIARSRRPRTRTRRPNRGL